MRLKLALILFLKMSLMAFSNNTDSLYKVLESNEISKKERAELLLKICALDYRNNPDTCLELINKSIQLSRELGDHILEAKTVTQRGVIKVNMGKYDESLEDYFFGLKIYEQFDDTAGIGKVFNNVAINYWYQGNFDRAHQYIMKALPYRLITKDTLQISRAYTNIGILNLELGRLDSALFYYEISKNLKLSIGDSLGILKLYNNIGVVYEKKMDFDKAIEYYQKALDMAIERNETRSICVLYDNIAIIESQLGNYDKATEYSLKSLEIARQLNDLEDVKYALKNLSENYFRQGNPEEAYKTLVNYIAVKDSLLNVDKTKTIEELEAKYQTEKKEVEIKLLNKNSLLDKAKIKEQKLLGYIIIVIALGLAVIAFFIYINLRQKKNSNQILTLKNQEIEEKNEELNQTNEEILAQRDQIENQKNIIQEKHEQLEASIYYAKKIQQAILPKEEHVNESLPEHFILYKPRDIVSGDFYWADIKDDHLYIAVADCTGHGVPGAFMSMLGMSFLNQINRTNKLLSPSQILEKLKKSVIRELKQEGLDNEAKDGMDIALVKLNMKNLELEYSGAYNPLYILNSNRNSVEIPEAREFGIAPNGWEIKATKQPIGISMMKKDKAFINHKIKLIKGDSLFIFTDGYADQFGGERESKFTYGRMKLLLSENVNLSMPELKNILDKQFMSWKGNNNQTDDVCVIGVRV